MATAFITLQLIKFFPAMRFHSQLHFACPVMPDRASSYSYDKLSSSWPIESLLQRRKVSLSRTFRIIICAFFCRSFSKELAFRYCKVLARIAFESKGDRDTVARSMHRSLIVDLFLLLFLLGRTTFPSSTVVDTSCTLLDQQSPHLSSRRRLSSN